MFEGHKEKVGKAMAEWRGGERYYLQGTCHGVPEEESDGGKSVITT